MTLVPGADSFPSQILIPDDVGSPRAAVSVNVPFEGLANRTQYLNLRTPKLGENNTFVGINTFSNSVIVNDAFISRLRQPAPVDLADTGDQTITTAGGWLYRVPSTASPSRIIRLGSAVNGDMIRVMFTTLSIGGGVWKVRRLATSTDIVVFDNTGASFDVATFADFIYDVTVWRYAGGAGHIQFGGHA